ncbi:MAG TPA: FAD-dependent monooxygenase [Myxococcota bacterium]|nr:FAD-dependent monooxygenase [Myxococcota bacterium]
MHFAIVGAGPAGAAPGYLLSRASGEVTLLERQTDFAREAARWPGFRLERGLTVRDLLTREGAVVGVRGDSASGPREIAADWVIGADGRASATRKHSGLPEVKWTQRLQKVALRFVFERTAATRFAVRRLLPALAHTGLLPRLIGYAARSFLYGTTEVRLCTRSSTA